MAHYETAPRNVVEARYVGDYRVWLQFDDGRRGLVDLADELHGEHGADFASEFLYEKLVTVH
jgi:hypothetical protein